MTEGGPQSEYTIERVLKDEPLYSPLKLSSKDKSFLENLRRSNVQIDEYCVGCGKDATFKPLRSFGSGSGTPVDVNWMIKDAIFSVKLSCTRAGHDYNWFFELSKMVLRKVGQTPSFEEIGRSELRKYQGVLGKEQYGELKRATGLVSHGIGIGSYVYLRRVFEKLIDTHRTELEKSGTLVENYDKLRMSEKISALSSVLPPALVKNKVTYSILSKGIHELDEETCRKHFPVLLAAIVQIAEQDFQKKERDRLDGELESQIQRINSELSLNQDGGPPATGA